MTEDNAQASNDGQLSSDTASHLIECFGDSPCTYFSEKIGLDYGSPAGGWTRERDQATAMTASAAQVLLDGPLASMAPFCQVVAK